MLKRLICIKMDDYENYVSDGVFGMVMIMMMMMMMMMIHDDDDDDDDDNDRSSGVCWLWRSME